MGIASLTKSAQLLSPDLHILTDEELQALQQVLLEITGDFARVCQTHGIPWSLAGGSALGAVRHGGFIPWDDDMDVSMRRQDFEVFKTVFPGELADKYELKLPGDPGYLYQFPRICRKNTLAQSIQSAKDQDEPVAVDIFIFENASDNKLLRKAHGLLCNACLLADSVLRMDRCKENLLKYGACSPPLCKAVKKRARLAVLFRFMKLERWLKLTDRVFTLCRNAQSEYIVIPSGNGHFFGELYLREKMETVKPVLFEGRQFYVPADTEYLLSTRYGKDYMAMPCEQERERHAFVRFDLGKTEKTGG